MSANTNSEKRKKFIMTPHLGRLKRDTMKKIPTGIIGISILTLALAGFLGAYFWTSYSGGEIGISIQEKMLSVHDDLFGINGGTGGNNWIVGKYGLILHTNDGGRKWEKQESGTGQVLLGVSFADDRVGFAVGGGGVILATPDGGASWTMQRPGEEQLLGVQALDKTRAYAVGAFGSFFATSDGGKTWNRYKFTWEKLIPRIIEELGGNIEPNLNAVHFVTKEIGWIVGEFGLILHTGDGGRTWALQRGGRNLPQLCAVIFRDERQGWAIGQEGTLLWTKDGGQHWFQSELGIKRDLYAAALEGERVVFVGDRLFLKTENGGSNWTRKDFAENVVFNAVSLMGKSATAVGLGGVIRPLDQ